MFDKNYMIILMMAFSFATASQKYGLRLGGKACESQSNYCQNGGTCYTQVAFQTVEPYTTSKPMDKPVCGCQPQYIGPQCQVLLTTTEQPSPAPTTVPTLTTSIPPRTLPPLICKPPATPAPTEPQVICTTSPIQSPIDCKPSSTQAPAVTTTVPTQGPVVCVVPTTPAPNPAPVVCTSPPTTAPTPAPVVCTASPTPVPTAPQLNTVPAYGLERAFEARNLCNLLRDTG